MRRISDHCGLSARPTGPGTPLALRPLSFLSASVLSMTVSSRLSVHVQVAVHVSVDVDVDVDFDVDGDVDGDDPR